ncbi:MAG: hypothetical protein IPM29_12555 [Planctomycetes bacterium]|nr:hypothetical protein [Planctomycetota bacterium]
MSLLPAAPKMPRAEPMKHPALTQSVRLAVVVACLCGCSLTAPRPDQLKVRDLDWLSGTWRGETDAGVVEQEWSLPELGLMHGEHRTLQQGRVVLRAELRILGGLNGIALYGAPDGDTDRIYGLVAAGRRRLTFASARRDFPSEGTFERSGDRLTVTFRGRDELAGPRELRYELHLVADPVSAQRSGA